MTNAKERCEHFRRISRKKKKAYVVRENSFPDEKEAKSHVSGQAEIEEANTASGVWARDHGHDKWVIPGRSTSLPGRG